MVVLATAAIVGIVGWAASPVINRLIGKALKFAADKYKWQQGVPEKLETLAHFLHEIGSTWSLVEAERRISSDPNMVCWLSQLRGAIDEIEDIFDLLDYHHETPKPSQSQPDMVGHSARHASISAAAAAEQPAAAPTAPTGTGEAFDSRLKKLLEKLDDIRQSSRGLVQASLLAAATAGSSCSSGAGAGARAWRRATGPLPPREPIGYDDQYEHLVTRLLQLDLELEDGDAHAQQEQVPAAVAIVGHGGMGKTTLAQRACDDPRVRAHFDMVIWAWAYDKFSEADLLAEIWRSAAEARDAETSFASLVRKLAGRDVPAVWNALTGAARHGEAAMSFGSMQQALQKLASSKRYLLVLDDVCHDEMATDLRIGETWSNVLAPFRGGKRGSRVLVTTRAVVCARTLGAGAGRRIALHGIAREPFVRLLKRTAAFPDSEHDELDEALRTSSALLLSSSAPAPEWRCSPLAAREIGLMLRSSRDRSKNKWEEILSTDCHENVVAAHVSSYQDLPPHLQCCFAFLSLFPDKFVFQPELLVRMWVAHGFISDDGKNYETMEDTAAGYFNQLVSRSLLQQYTTTDAAKSSSYVIHEQIHSMLRSVSANHFMMVHDETNFSPKKIPLTVRHLSVTTRCLKHLRKHSVLKGLRTLLVFRDPSSSPLRAIHELDILKELSGVRVLDLTGTGITDLPQAISNLIHLRFLALPGTIHKFPTAVTRLFHLQTLIASNGAKSMNLEVTFRFCAKTASLEHLAGMNSLRGSLSITGLDSVASKEDAQKAQLRKKKSVGILKFEWDAKKDASSIPDLDVLEGLQPHAGLQRLHIRRYRGTSSPDWLANNYLQRLTHLYIINCRKWKVLPPLDHLPRLNHLHIQEMNSVEQIDGSGSFMSLQTLELSDMKSLVQWTTNTSDSKFTVLKSIVVKYCPKLEKLPTMPTTVKPNITECPRLKI